MYTGQTKLTSSGTNNKKRFKISPCFDYWSEKAVFKNKKIFHNIALDLRFKIKIRDHDYMGPPGLRAPQLWPF